MKNYFLKSNFPIPCVYYCLCDLTGVETLKWVAAVNTALLIKHKLMAKLTSLD